MGNIYGYIRVSTKEQNADRQLLAMEALSIPKGNIKTRMILSDRPRFSLVESGIERP